MADLIDRAKAIKAIEDMQDCYNGFSSTFDKAQIIGVLEEVPTAEPQILSEILSELTKKERTDRYHVWTTHEVKQWFADRIMERGQDGKE